MADTVENSFQFQIVAMIEGDSGEYSCEMSEVDEDIEKARHFVVVTVFDRQAWQVEDDMNGNKSENEEKFSLTPMGVLAPGSAHVRPSAQPPIDMSGNFSPHVSAE